LTDFQLVAKTDTKLPADIGQSSYDQFISISQMLRGITLVIYMVIFAAEKGVQRPLLFFNGVRDTRNSHYFTAFSVSL